MESVRMIPLMKSLKDCVWKVPGSKSITNRALILAALRSGTTVLRGVLHSDDTLHMRNALVALGIDIQDVDDTSLRVVGGVERLKAPNKQLFIGNSGTTVRFLCVLCCLVPGDVTLVGDDHMAKRPIGFLGDALTQMGVSVDCPTGCPPLTIRGSKTQGLPGGKVSMPGYKSSQYFSALMLTGGFAQQELEIQVEGELVSFPYVAMSMQMVKDFGVGEIIHDSENNRFFVKKKKSVDDLDGKEFEYVIEPDASSASYPFALAAATHSCVTVPNLTDTSMQGDFGFTKVLEKMGCSVEIDVEKKETRVCGPGEGRKLLGVDIDMHHISDTVMTLAAIAPLCDGPVTIRNVGNIRIKETDRLEATVTELKKLGQQVESGEDWLRITPVLPVVASAVDCYSDHRMAMSFAILGKAVDGVTITDKGCTAKTYPNFFQDLEAVCRSEEQVEERETKKLKLT